MQVRVVKRYSECFLTRIEKLEQKEGQFARLLTELQRKNDALAMDKLRLEYRLMVFLKRHYGPWAYKIGTEKTCGSSSTCLFC